MAKKCKCPPAGAPEWVLTYGDMMSLLLVFFIMIVALSEIKKQEEYQEIVANIQGAFGMRGGAQLPIEGTPALSLLKFLQDQRLRRHQEENRSNTQDPGMDGSEATVTRIREGMRFAVGGRITFEPGSADLSQQAREALKQVASLLRGYTNIIELRGHADAMELPDDGTFADLWALSYARAKAVMEYLCSDELGIERNRIRLVANADREPLAPRAHTVAQKEPNRRVEIIVVEALAQSFTEPETSGPDASPGIR